MQVHRTHEQARNALLRALRRWFQVSDLQPYFTSYLRRWHNAAIAGPTSHPARRPWRRLRGAALKDSGARRRDRVARSSL